jgi:hypothetical protein
MCVLVAVCLVWATVPVRAGEGGSQLWVRRYGGTFLNLAQVVATSPDGSTVFVTGTGYLRGSDSDFVTIAYDAMTGARRWMDRYDGPAGAEDYVDSLVVSSDGSRVFVAGTSYGSGSDDVATVAYRASTGARLWVARQGPPARQDYARGLAVSPDGSRVFVTGTTEHLATQDDAVTVAYRASTGRALWTDRYRGPGDSSDGSQSLAVSPDGSTIFASVLGAGVSGARALVLLAYDAVTGARRWVRSDTGSLAFTGATPLTIVVGADGSALFVGGTVKGRDRGTDMGTVAYDSGSGARIWARRYAGLPRAYDFGNALVVSNDGSTVFVAGHSSSGPSTSAYATVAYRADTGATVWSRRYGGPVDGHASANAIAVAPDGMRVYVTGDGVGRRTAGDYATVAYRVRDGSKLWSARYDGPSSDWDFALGIAVSPNGARVFVTGGSEGGGVEFFATVAYRG